MWGILDVQSSSHGSIAHKEPHIFIIMELTTHLAIQLGIIWLISFGIIGYWTWKLVKVL